MTLKLHYFQHSTLQVQNTQESLCAVHGAFKHSLFLQMDTSVQGS